MRNIEVALGDYPLEGEPYVALLAKDRQSLLDLLGETKARNNHLEITMPCGYSQVFRELEDIPDNDLPCLCRKEGRYLIKYNKGVK